ncbi:MAG: UDP-N-acetylmuramoyl-L-alanyl-D-glutamate--2,6-diaminopimelate ligase, partial [Burkholderiaceae bacterium]
EISVHGIERLDDDVACYPELKKATGLIAAEYYGHPSSAMNVIAVTGTNGKTSTVWWLAQALSALKNSSAKKCGMIGTLGVGHPVPISVDSAESQTIVSNGLTTPDPVLLQQAFRNFVNAGFTACAIEASSIGIAEERLSGTSIAVAVFTNFTQDHLDYHGSMDAYWEAKLRLFSWPTLQAVVINIDDQKGRDLLATLKPGQFEIWTTSILEKARLNAHDIGYFGNGLQFKVTEDEQTFLLRTPMIGAYNVSNLLGVIASMRALDIGLEFAVEACQLLTPVPGRMDCVSSAGQPSVVVDYAHTPDALKNALIALRLMANQRQGRLICIFGCGGNRDTSKRPLMAAIVEAYADVVVVTSDNSRNENQEHIFSQIMGGFHQPAKVTLESDRAIAILQSIQNAQPSDVILIAGKGHENYQEIGDERHFFSDKAHAISALDRRCAA